MDGIDIDLFNKEQRPFNYDGDCLEYGEYLHTTGIIDNSDELYEARRDKQMEKELEEYGEDYYDYGDDYYED